MTKDEFENLKKGDMVRSKSANISYMVIVNFKSRVTAIRIADMTNPDEWEKDG